MIGIDCGNPRAFTLHDSALLQVEMQRAVPLEAGIDFMDVWDALTVEFLSSAHSQVKATQVPACAECPSAECR